MLGQLQVLYTRLKGGVEGVSGGLQVPCAPKSFADVYFIQQVLITRGDASASPIDSRRVKLAQFQVLYNRLHERVEGGYCKNTVRGVTGALYA